MAPKKRVQVTFTAEQYAMLAEYALESGSSLSAVIREVVSTHLETDLSKARKRKALERIVSGNDPVLDWPEMEREWEATRYTCNP